MIEHVANDDWLGIDFLFFVKSCNANSQRDVVGSDLSRSNKQLTVKGGEFYRQTKKDKSYSPCCG